MLVMIFDITELVISVVSVYELVFFVVVLVLLIFVVVFFAYSKNILLLNMANILCLFLLQMCAIFYPRVAIEYIPYSNNEHKKNTLRKKISEHLLNMTVIPDLSMR